MIISLCFSFSSCKFLRVISLMPGHSRKMLPWVGAVALWLAVAPQELFPVRAGMAGQMAT